MANGTQTQENFFGTLKISAFSPTVGRPAPDTAVSIRESGSSRLIFAGLTDSEGQLAPVILPAPSELISQTPPGEVQILPPSADQLISELNEGNMGDISPAKEPQPFSSFDVTAVSAEGERTEINGVQVYQNSVSLQSIIFPGQDDEIDIPDPNIMGGFPEKIPEADQKPMPPAQGEVVLPQPVIPETIVVHDGVPGDRNAENYYVDFQDYIKNVASSEIFTTWPREAIKANVIAIISFTLNRVYTEWYRGKGYDFTVTNSTAYDQAFVYGRNVFSEIDQIVDEVFTIYITREDATQPLLAQYCDGIRVNRSGWLSQWGSKQLADSGYDALRILRTFYGRDIVLREAQRVQGIPVSFQGTLSRGSRGPQVRVLQQQLNGISDNFPLIPKLSVDGIFGPKTEQAVKVFQQIFNLPQSGIVDFATWYRISDIYVAVKKLAE